MQDHVLPLRSPGQRSCVGGIDEFPGLARRRSRACFLNLGGKRIAIELGANQHAGVGIAVGETSLIQVAEKSQGLALSSQLLGGMQVFRLRRTLLAVGPAARRAAVESNWPPARSGQPTK